ncbi:MAG: DUF4389 domain-containing protein [Chloroflexi bacterium]|nr:DUF4389 domain-containing protein [Chloroflexota bacterium]
MATSAYPAKPETTYPVSFDVEYPDHLSRLLIFFKWLLAIPHFIVLYVLMLAWMVTTFISWFAILFTAHYPRGLFNFACGVFRWTYRVEAYLYFLRDDYPPFRLSDGEGQTYPVSFNAEYPDHLSRLLIFVKWLLVIPHFIVLYVLGIVVSVTTFVSWFAILFTARYPKGLFDLAVGYFRWNARVAAYLMYLRDEYPPFSLS